MAVLWVDMVLLIGIQLLVQLALEEPPGVKMMYWGFDQGVTMTFSETSPEIFSGEIRSIDVEFRNVGPVDMGRIFVAVSHTDCVSLVENEKKSDFNQLYDEKYKEHTHYPDDRSARAAWWREMAARHVRVAATGVSSGAHSRAILLLRPHTCAPTIHLLAYYETGDPQRPYRLLRHTFNFQVMEAVEISLVPRRSLEDSQGHLAENLILVVEVKNVIEENLGALNVDVSEISLLSRQWKLTDNQRALFKNEVLFTHERLHLIFRAQRIMTSCIKESIEYSCIKVSPGNVNDDADITQIPFSQFLTDYKPFFVDNLEPPVQNSNNNMGLIQSMFIIRWKVLDQMKSRVVVGQHCIWLDCFNKADPNYSTVAVPRSPTLQFDEFESKPYSKTTKTNKENCVEFRLEHNNRIYHNFKSQKLCLVPVKLNIVNCYGIPVRVFIETSKEQNIGESLLGWAGALNNNELGSNKLVLRMDLEMYESLQVEVRAICSSPGTYTLGSNFSMTALRKCDQQPVSQNIENSSLLVVQNVC